MSLAKCLAKLNAGKPVFSQDEIKEINQAVLSNLHQGMGQDAAEKAAVDALLKDAVSERDQIVSQIKKESPQKSNPKNVYRAYPITEDDRASLLKEFKPTHDRVIADHITAEGIGSMDQVVEGPAKGEVIGISDFGGMQSLVVSINGKVITGDGTPFHISWSADPGIKSGTAGTIIRDNGYRKLETPIPLDLSSGPSISKPVRESAVADLARKANESDKEFAKRVVDKRRPPEALPENHADYFKMEGATVLPISSLVSTKSAEENQQGGENGAKRMLAAANGELSKRGPITVMPAKEDGGKYQVVDGNGTLTSVSKYGWESMPVTIVSRAEGQRMMREDKAKDADKEVKKNGLQYKGEKYIIKASNFDKQYNEPAILKANVPGSVLDQAQSVVDKYFKERPQIILSPEDQERAEGLLRPVMDKAAEAKDAYDQMVLDVAESSGAIGAMLADLKGIGRAAVKLAKEEKYDVTGIKDLLRSTIVMNDYASAKSVIDEIKKRFKIIRIKNRSMTDLSGPNIKEENREKFGGYSDVLINVEMPNGTIAEIQINTPVMLAAKSGAGHKLYEIYRDLDKETEFAKEIFGEMLTYYGSAFSAANSRLDLTQFKNTSSEIGAAPDLGSMSTSRIEPPSSDTLNSLPSGNLAISSPLNVAKNLQPSGNLSGTRISTTSDTNIANNQIGVYTNGIENQREIKNESLREDRTPGNEGQKPVTVSPTPGEWGTGSVRSGEGGPNSGRDLHINDGDLNAPGRPEGNGPDQEGRDVEHGETSGAGKGIRRGDVGVPAGREIPPKTGRNYSFGDSDLTYEGSWHSKAKQNVDAIELLKKLESEGRQANKEEQAILGKFIGWGSSEIANSLFGDKYEGFDSKVKAYDRAIAILGERDSMTRYDRDYYSVYSVALEGNPKFPYGDEVSKSDLQKAKPEAAGRKWVELQSRLKGLLSKEEWNSAARSTQNAHYTSKPIVQSMMKAMQAMGFNGGSILEPGAGIGVFPGLMPKSMAINSVYTGIEMESITGGILKQLFPDERILVESYVDTKIPENFYDVAFGNPPFAAFNVLADPKYAKNAFVLHDYFFAKTVDSVKPGGIMMFVTSRYTMDKAGDKARKYLADRADLLGAIRLPQTAFKKNAGTEVVTDVLILRKKVKGEEFDKGHAWGKLETIQTPQGPAMVNEYFAAHPEMILGKSSLQGSMYSKNEYTVLPNEGNIEEQFDKAASNLPKDVFVVGRGSAAEAAKVREIDFNPKAKKEGNYYVADNGNVMVLDNGVGVPADIPKERVQLVKDFVVLRDLLKEAHYDQFNDGPWEESLAALKKGYDKFVEEHGRLNQYVSYMQRVKVDELDENGEPTGKRVWDEESRLKYPLQKHLMLDPDSTLVFALDKVDDETGTVKDGDWLTKRVLGRESRVSPSTPQDAMLQVLNETGEVNMKAIADRLGLSEKEAISSLGSLVYEDPKEGWQTRDAYLSGNIVTKLRDAKEAAKSDKNMERNVEALLAAMPAQRTADEIKPQIGMSWIPTKHYEKFLLDISGVSATVHYNERTGQWAVEEKSGGRSLGATADWGISEKWNATTIFSHALDNSPIRVTQKDADGKPSLDPVSTASAVEKRDAMRKAFADWLWADKARVDELVPLYNEKYNSLVPREFDGRHLTLPGVSRRWNVFDHVKRGAWRIIQSGNTYLAHAVGSGKTFEMIISAMEQKRLGLVKKPMMVVPNHMLKQFSSEWQDLYPAARLMVADDEHFTGDNRRKFVARAAMSDLDGIIITHSAFKILDLDPEFKEKMINQELDFLRASYKELGENPDDLVFDKSTDDKGKETITLSKRSKAKSTDPKVKQIQRKIEGMEQKLLQASSSEGKDTNVRFDEMGVDMLYVDEAHEFRKLAFTTLRQAKGIDSNGSQKAFDLYMKTRWLAERYPGRNLVMASGTPITNTVAEIYSVQRFMQPEVLAERGIEEFDQWASMFGEDATAIEPDAAGKYANVTRFSKFVNVPELIQMFREFADVLTSDHLAQMLGDKRPSVFGGARNIKVTPKTESYQRFLDDELRPRMEASRAWKPSSEQPYNPDPVIAIITAGRLGAIDTRFANPKEPNEKGSKLNVMIDNVIERYNDTADYVYYGKEGKEGNPGPEEKTRGGTQIVFSNIGFGAGVAASTGFNARAWFEKRLVEGGVKKEHIAFMSDYKKASEKAKLFKDVNSGKVRIIVGSTMNMGTGTNIQQRLTDLHHLDAPWYPADLEQREGRIIRQGNKNKSVKIHAYATKGSYDEQMWSTLARKQLFIDQALSGDPNLREIEDLGEASQMEIAAAMIADDPRVLVLAGKKGEYDKLLRLEYAHENKRRQFVYEYNLSKQHIESAEKQIPGAEQQAKKVKDLSGDNFSVKVGKETITIRKDAGEAILAKYKELADKFSTAEMKIAEISGFDIVYKGVSDKDGKAEDFKANLFLMTEEPSVFAEWHGVDPVGLMIRATNKLSDIARKPDELRLRIEEAKKNMIALAPRLDAPFPMLQMLRDKRAEIISLENEITATAPDGMAKEQELEDAWQAKTGAITPLFSRSAKAVKESAQYFVGSRPNGSSIEEVQRAVDHATQGMDNPPPVRIVKTTNDLPFDAPDDVRGAFWDKHVYLVAENISGHFGAIEVYAHETMGHYGLRGFFGDSLDPALDFIHDVNPKVQKDAQDWKDRNQDLIKDLKKGGNDDQYIHYRSIEEAMSNWAQKGETLKGAKRLLVAIQKALRALGLKTWANRLEAATNAEALLMLKQSAMFVQSGLTKESGTVKPLFSTMRDSTLAGDLAEQEKFLDKSAKDLGYRNVDELALKDYPAFEKLAIQWRQQHPVAEALYSREIAGELPPEETKAEGFQRVTQDAFNRFKIVQDWLEKNGVKITDKNNTYNAEIRMHGRFANKAQDFREKVIEPLVESVQKAGFKLSQIDEYLHAQHAEERNIQVAKVNPQMPDGGSGMMTSKARDILEKADPKLVELANKFQKITEGTKQILIDSGIISPDVAAAWDGAYKHYVPLKGGDDSSAQGAGKGLSANGKQLRALGHGARESEHIIENIARDRERALLVAEHNEVGKHLLALALDANNDSLISIDKPEKRGVLMPGKTTYDVRYHGSSIASFNNKASALTFIEQMGKPGFFIAESKGDPAVQYMARPQLQENEVLVYLSGNTVRLQLNDEILAREYKKLGIEQLGMVFEIGRAVNNWLSKAYTAYNPEFLLRNIRRDFTTGLINVTADYGGAMARKAAANYLGAGRDMLVYSMTGKSTPLIDQYRASGGNVGAAYLSDIERIGQDIKANFERATGVIGLVQSGQKAAAARVAYEKAIGGLLGWVEHLNAAGENAMRLAVFKALVDSGKSTKQAAVAAKGMTLNFNKKGEIGARLGSLFLFYNPAVQDVARLSKTLIKSDHKAQAWAIVGGLAMLQFLSGLLQFGNDDDGEYRRIPANIRNKNFIIRTGKDSYINWDIPYGFGWFFGIGNAVYENYIGMDKKKIGLHLAAGFLDNFSPIGNPLEASGELVPANIAPFVPMKDWLLFHGNKTAFGSPIMPDSETDKKKPDHLRMWKGTKGGVADSAAQWLNDISGGTKTRPGAIDVSPETLKWLVSTLGGGTATFLTDTAHLASLGIKAAAASPADAKGYVPELREIPILRGVAKEESIQWYRAQFYEASKEALKAKDAFDLARKERDVEAIKDMTKEDKSLVSLAHAVTGFNKAIKSLRDREVSIQVDKTHDDGWKRIQIKEVEKKEQELYEKFFKLNEKMGRR